jgi:hypothetical protein
MIKVEVSTRNSYAHNDAVMPCGCIATGNTDAKGVCNIKRTSVTTAETSR